MVMRMLRTQVKWIMLVVAVIFVISIFAVYIYRGNGGGNAAQSDRAVAEVNGKKVMLSQIDSAVRSYVEHYGLKDISPSDLPSLRRSVLDSIIVEGELEKEVQARSIQVTQEEIDAAIAYISQQFPTKESFEDYLKNNGITMEVLREEIARQIAQRKLLQQASEGVSVSEEETREYYDAMKESLFKRPKGYLINVARFKEPHVAEIVKEDLSDKPDVSSWNELMELHSNDVISHTPYEDPVFLNEESLKQQFGIQELSKGEILGPEEIASGDYALFLVMEEKPEEVVSFDVVSGDVEKFLYSQKAQQRQQEFLEELIKRAEVKLLEPELFEVASSDQPEVPQDEAVSDDVASSDLGSEAPQENAEP